MKDMKTAVNMLKAGKVDAVVNINGSRRRSLRLTGM